MANIAALKRIVDNAKKYVNLFKMSAFNEEKQPHQQEPQELRKEKATKEEVTEDEAEETENCEEMDEYHCGVNVHGLMRASLFFVKSEG